MLLEFGQPLDAICQFAYVVEDLEAAQDAFSTQLGAGPWFVRGPFVPSKARLYGEPNAPTITLARAFSGHMMIELVLQSDDGPSVYHDPSRPRSYGFHHWATMTRDFDATVARYADSKFTEAYYDELPSGARIMYVANPSMLPGMIEVVEHTPEQERIYTEMFLSSHAHRLGLDSAPGPTP